MFTPTREVAYSGHTRSAPCTPSWTRRACGRPRRLRDRAGRAARGHRGARGWPRLWLEPPLPVCAAFTGSLADILGALGVAAPRLGRWARPAVTPDTDLLLPVADLAALHALRPDLGRLGEIGTAHGLRAFCLVSPETVEPASLAHSRFFAPQFGIPEDIVTGSVHSSLGVWLHEAGRLRAGNGIAAFTAEQGDVLGRPGRLAVEVHIRRGGAHRVRVGGRAVTVLTGPPALTCPGHRRAPTALGRQGGYSRVCQSPRPSDRSPVGSTRACRSTAPQCR